MSERREAMKAKSIQRRINKEMVTKEFTCKSNVEESSLEATQEYNGITIAIQRKAYNQTRGKEVDFNLSKKEAEELRDYLTKALENWDEWNGLEK